MYRVYMYNIVRVGVSVCACCIVVCIPDKTHSDVQTVPTNCLSQSDRQKAAGGSPFRRFPEPSFGAQRNHQKSRKFKSDHRLISTVAARFFRRSLPQHCRRCWRSKCETNSELVGSENGIPHDSPKIWRRPIIFPSFPLLEWIGIASFQRCTPFFDDISVTSIQNPLDCRASPCSGKLWRAPKVTLPYLPFFTSHY